jgi:hypothetical protein
VSGAHGVPPSEIVSERTRGHEAKHGKTTRANRWPRRRKTERAGVQAEAETTDCLKWWTVDEGLQVAILTDLEVVLIVKDPVQAVSPRKLADALWLAERFRNREAEDTAVAALHGR